MSKTVYIIGGGAAGFFCAINMANLHPDYSITILEKTTKLLSKVLVSGGGRCNTTHYCFDNSEMVKNYPRGFKELRGIFSRFSVKDTIEWFQERGVDLNAEADGRMFPSTNSSQTIIDCFMEQAKEFGVKVKCKMEVLSISEKADGLALEIKEDLPIAIGTKEIKKVNADVVVIATGGFPMKKGYSFLEKTTHTIVEPIPSLYTFNVPKNPVTELMGVSVKEATIKIGGTPFVYSGPLLITHWGFSGPAVLKLSAFAARHFNETNYNADILINWVNIGQEQTRTEFLKQTNGRKMLPKNSNIFNLPKRLWEFLLLKAEIDPNIAWEETAKRKINKIIELLSNDTYHMQGKTTFKEEFVTCGGIPLNEIDCKTMQSKKLPGLYFAGEVLNMDGITGGFNFQAAWSTAWVVANSIV
ncbi:MAG: NAD(P)/FAD-dependent oxidoreductase [Bacteroidota bacterium]|nr:NAD(P)/FAD-dependent oxidoreductase [Bacteroidota bacterium]